MLAFAKTPAHAAINLATEIATSFADAMRPHRAKLGEVKVQHDLIERDIENAQTSLAARDTVTQARAEAIAILDGGTESSLAVDDAIRQSLTAMYRRRNAYREAVGEQEKRVVERDSTLSKEACEKARPEWLELIKDYAESLAETGRRAAALRAFRRTLEDGGISTGSLGNGILGVGTMCIDEEHSQINIWLSEIEKDHGIRPKR